jgi:MFS family permease
VLAASLFGLSLGEELWQAYLPAFLIALGAGGAAVGAFSSLKDLLDGLYQYPGGWLSDRLGRRRALLMLTALATGGYTIYALAPTWPIMVVGLVAVMAWKAGAFPTTFAIIGDAVPRERRATAFAIQSVLVRLPRVLSAPVGGIVIAILGLLAGVRVSCAITAVIAFAVLCVQHRFFREKPPVGRSTIPTADGWFWSIPVGLRRLLVADCLVRIGEGVAASFIVLFVTQIASVSVARYGLLYAIQQAVAIATYLPGARLAGFTGRRPVVALTFLFFASFPLAVSWARHPVGLLCAFIIGGLKELGEPARKSLILDLSPETRRASTVGAYYAIRNLLIVPAGLTGGLLWQWEPHLPLEVGGALSLIGVIVFLATSWHSAPRAAKVEVVS